jgi:hypothetical protein
LRLGLFRSIPLSTKRADRQGNPDGGRQDTEHPAAADHPKIVAALVFCIHSRDGHSRSGQQQGSGSDRSDDDGDRHAACPPPVRVVDRLDRRRPDRTQ